MNIFLNINKKHLLIKFLVITSISLSLLSCTAAIIGGAAATGVATAADARGGGNVIDDQTLEHNVNNVLSAQVPDGSFTVASYAKEVLLLGQVPTNSDKAKAKSAVENTAGVKKVWNYLTVGPNETATAITQDAYLTSSAKTILIAEKGVNANNIKVVTSNKTVYLLGRDAGDSGEIHDAVRRIKNVSGVHHVVNLIGQ